MNATPTANTTTPATGGARPRPARGHPAALTAAIMRSALLVAVAALVAVCLVALVVDLALASGVRGWLDYPFSGLSADPGTAVTIFVHNVRAVAGVFGLLVIAQTACRRPGGPSRTQRAVLVAGELVVAGMVAENIVMIGAAVGTLERPRGRGHLIAWVCPAQREGCGVHAQDASAVCRGVPS